MNQNIVYLCHIRDAINKIENYASVVERVFLETFHWQDAVIRNLEIIGEATKRLSAKLKADNSTIPWREIAGLRDVLIHDYMGGYSCCLECGRTGYTKLKVGSNAIISSI